MKKIIILIVICLFIGGCKTKSSISNIEIDEVYANIDNSNYHIIDVRRLYEYEAGHIKNATLIPVDEIDTIEDIVLDKNSIVVVYCRTGGRSRQAAERLIELGYKQVFDMGGIDNWTYELVTEE